MIFNFNNNLDNSSLASFVILGGKLYSMHAHGINPKKISGRKPYTILGSFFLNNFFPLIFKAKM